MNDDGRVLRTQKKRSEEERGIKATPSRSRRLWTRDWEELPTGRERKVPQEGSIAIPSLLADWEPNIFQQVHPPKRRGHEQASRKALGIHFLVPACEKSTSQSRRLCGAVRSAPQGHPGPRISRFQRRNGLSRGSRHLDNGVSRLCPGLESIGLPVDTTKTSLSLHKAPGSTLFMGCIMPV